MFKIRSDVFLADYDLTIWHGGNVQVKSVSALLEHVGEAEFATLLHEFRETIWDEAEVCIRNGLDDPDVIRRQVQRYVEAGFDGSPLYAAFLVVRRNTGLITALNSCWWDEVQGGSVRDQISLPFCLWRCGVEVRVIPGGVASGPFHRRRGHGE